VSNKLELCIDPEIAQELAASSDTEEYKFIDNTFLGEWRWGNEYSVVFQDSNENYWEFEYKESVGDEYWSSIDSSKANFVACHRVKPVEVVTVKYARVKDVSQDS
jgi:hypothetical protein